MEDMFLLLIETMIAMNGDRLYPGDSLGQPSLPGFLLPRLKGGGSSQLLNSIDIIDLINAQSDFSTL